MRRSADVIDHDTFSAVRKVDDGRLHPAHAMALAEAALQRCELGVLHLAVGDVLAKLSRGAEAADAYRRGLAVTGEPDVRTRLLVSLSAVVADRAERTRRLREAIDLSGNLVAAAMATVFLASSSTPN